jgi:ABC-type Zn uptake system ZnuABC Zn-binding protein ZnuA
LEAKNVYQKLLKRFPEKENLYKSKISDIENKIKSQTKNWCPLLIYLINCL